MTGSEHYLAAESLLEAVESEGTGKSARDLLLVQVFLAQAQVHAVLALAAATAWTVSEKTGQPW